MHTPTRHTIGIAVAVMLLVGCAPTEAQIQKALEETRQVQDAVQAALAGTQAALLALTPTEPPIPPTSTNTATPEVTSTSAPPPGQAYVPDLVGLNIEDAKATCSAADLPFYWVALINKDVPEHSVFAQTPAPGNLIDLDADRNADKLKLIMSVFKYTPEPESDKGGSATGDPCGGLTYEGICDGNVAYWCENNQVWYYDCGWCGGTCGWDPAYGNGCSCW